VQREVGPFYINALARLMLSSHLARLMLSSNLVSERSPCCLVVCLCVCVSVYLSVSCLTVCLSVCLSVGLCAGLIGSCTNYEDMASQVQLSQNRRLRCAVQERERGGGCSSETIVGKGRLIHAARQPMRIPMQLNRDCLLFPLP
jgi:hypothetical protein